MTLVQPRLASPALCVFCYLTAAGCGGGGMSPTEIPPADEGAAPSDAATAPHSDLAVAPPSDALAPPSGPTIPSNAVAVTQIQALADWKVNHDPGTSGTSSGSMTLVDDPSLEGQSAKFSTSFADWGGEIYSKSYANDPNATHFVYDTYVWIEAGSVIGNLELDNNQVIANGDTVIYAFQCDGDHNAWDYTTNAGTPAHPQGKWLHSTQPCDPAKWTTNTWHHVQISYSRDDVGNVTYDAVWLDGVEAPIHETVPSAFSLGWGHGVLLTNFQVDGTSTSGKSVLYADSMTVSRW